MMKIDLSGKVVLVTGGSRGIGAAIVSQLAKAGATVAVHYGRQQVAAEAVVAAVGGKSRAFQADLRTAGAARQLVQAVLAHYGQVDVLVNNAGIAHSLPADADPVVWQQAWAETLQVNLIATAEACEALLPHFVARGGGRFVHIASRAAFRGDTPEYAAYAASKGGMVAYSRSLARGYGKQGITSFVVAPGFTRTEMAQQFIDEYGEAIVTGDLALSRITEPRDLAPTVVFLASGLMDHATGCTIDLNAGSYVH